MIIPGDFSHDSCVFSHTRHKSSRCRRVGCGSNSQPGICGNLVPEKHPSSGFEVAAARDSLLWFHSITVYAHCQLFLCHALQCFYLFFIFRLSSCRFYRLLGYRPCADSCLQKRRYGVPHAAAHRISAYIFRFIPARRDRAGYGSGYTYLCSS